MSSKKLPPRRATPSDVPEINRIGYLATHVANVHDRPGHENKLGETALRHPGRSAVHRHGKIQLFGRPAFGMFPGFRREYWTIESGGGVFLTTPTSVARQNPDPDFWWPYKWVSDELRRRIEEERREGDSREYIPSVSAERSGSEEECVPEIEIQEFVSDGEYREPVEYEYVYPSVDDLPYGDFSYGKRVQRTAIAPTRKEEVGVSAYCSNRGFSKAKTALARKVWASLNGLKRERVAKLHRFFQRRTHQNFVLDAEESQGGDTYKVIDVARKLDRSLNNSKTRSYLEKRLGEVARGVEKDDFKALVSANAPRWYFQNREAMSDFGMTYQGGVRKPLDYGPAGTDVHLLHEFLLYIFPDEYTKWSDDELRVVYNDVKSTKFIAELRNSTDLFDVPVTESFRDSVRSMLNLPDVNSNEHYIKRTVINLVNRVNPRRVALVGENGEGIAYNKLDAGFSAFLSELCGCEVSFSLNDFTHMHTLCCSVDPTARVLAGLNLLQGETCNLLCKKLEVNKQWLVDLLNSAFGDKTLQSLDSLSLFVRRIRNSDIVKQGGVLLLSAVSLGLFQNPVMAYVCSQETVDNFLNSSTVAGVFLDMLGAASKLIQRMSNFVRTGDLDVLFPDDSVEGIITRGEYYRTLLDEVGVSNMDPIPILAEAHKFCIKYSGNTNTLIRSLIHEIIALYTNITKNLSSGRAEPFGVIIYGPPGCGKTHFCKTFANYVSIERGVPSGVSGVFEYNNTKYQDVPPVVAATIINDYFSTTPESGFLNTEPLTFLQTLVDIFPVKVESAEVESKKKSYLYHSAVLVSSNANHYYCSQATSGINKLDRRYWIIQIKYNDELVKEKYNTMEDFEAAVKIGGHAVAKPYLEYVIGHMHNRGEVHCKDLFLEPKLVHKRVNTYEEAFSVMRDLYLQHMDVKKPLSYYCQGCRTDVPSVEADCMCELYGTARHVENKHVTPTSAETQNVFLQAFSKAHELVSSKAKTFQGLEEGLETDCSRFIYPVLAAVFTAGFFHVGAQWMGRLRRRCRQVEETTERVADELLSSLRKGVNVNVESNFLRHVFGRETLLTLVSKWMVLAGSLAVTFKVVSGLIDWYTRKGLFQGSIASVTNVPEEHSPVQPFTKNINPWLNHDLRNGWCRVVNKNTGAAMHAVLLTTRSIMFPSHFLGGGSPGVYRGPVVELELRYGDSQSQIIKIMSGQAWFSEDISGDSLAVVYVPNLMLPLVEVLSTTHSHDRPVGDLRVGNHKAKLVEVNGGSIAYELELPSGSCGLPIYDSRGVFYGLHHALYNRPLPTGKRLSCGMLFTREIFREAVADLEKEGCILYSNQPVLNLQQKFLGKEVHDEGPHPNSDLGKLMKFNGPEALLNSRHLPLGYFKKINSSKMTCRETMMYPAVSHLVQPMGQPYVGKAKFVDGQWRSPDLYRIENMRMTCIYDHIASGKAVRDYIQRFDFSFFETNPVGPLSDYQSFVGDPRNVAMNPKDPTKSIGPYLQSLGLKKEDVFKKIDDGIYEVHPELLSQMVEWERHLRSDEPLRAPTVLATLKDEAYPMEKVELCKARYFYVLDVAVNQVMRKYFLPIIAFFVANPTSSRMYTMMNAAGRDWEALHDHLASGSVDRAFDLDQKGMDLHNQVFWERIAWLMRTVASRMGYSPLDAYVVERSVLTLRAVVLVMNDNLYYSWGFLSSGWCLTIFFNCLCGELLLSSIYYQEFPKAVVGDFAKHIKTAHVGDDVAATLVEGVDIDPNIFQIRGVSWGYEITDGRKNPVVSEVSLYSISFIKRMFVRRGDRIVGPLDKQSIYKAIGYCTGIPRGDVISENERNISTLRSQMRECVLHDREFFDFVYQIATTFYPCEKFASYEALVEEMEYTDYVTWVSPPIGNGGISFEVSDAISECKNGGLIYQSRTSKWWVDYVPLVCSSFLLYFSGMLPVPFWVVSVFIAPLLEEYWKRQTLVGTLALIILETHNRISWTSYSVGLALSFVPNLMHVVAGSLPMYLAVGLHFVYNFLVSFSPYALGVTGQVSVYMIDHPMATYPIWIAAVVFGKSFVQTRLVRPDQVCIIQGQSNASLRPSARDGEGGLNFSDKTLQAHQASGRLTHIPGDLKCVTEEQQKSTETNQVSILNSVETTVPTEQSEAVVSFVSTAMVEGVVPRGESVVVRTTPKTELALADYFSRPRRVLTVNANSAGSSITAFTAWRTLPTVSAFLSQWRLFRGDLQIDVVVTGSNQLQGMWRLTAIPTRKADAYTSSVAGFVLSADTILVNSVLPHVDIDMSKAGKYTLNLPYPLQFPFMRLSGDSDYVLYLFPVNTVEAVNGLTPTSIPIEVWLSYKNVSLDVLTYQAGDDEKPVVSSLLSYASRIAKVAPFPWSSPASKILSLGASVASSLGYSRPPSEPSYNGMMRQSQNYAVTGGQSDFGYTLAMDTRAQTSVNTSVIPLSSPGETDINNVIRRWCHINRDVMEFLSDPLITTSHGTVRAFTPLSYCAHAFEYYTGSLDYCLQVVTSPLVRGRIGIAIFPPNTVTPATFPVNGSALTYVMDFSGTTCFEFNAPYMFRQDVVPLTVGQACPIVKFYWLMDPTGPSATPVIPHLNVYQRAGSDFEMGIPSLEKTENFTAPVGQNQDWTFQGTGPKTQALFGEVVDTIEGLSHRRTLWGEFNPTLVKTATLSVKPYPPLADTGLYAQTRTRWTYATWFSMMFLGENGSYDWICHDSPAATTTAELQRYVDASFATFENLGYSGRGFQALKGTPGWEYRIPNRCPTIFRTTASAGPGTYPVETLMVNTIRPTGTNHWPVYISGTGDDFVLGGFLCPPLLRLIQP